MEHYVMEDVLDDAGLDSSNLRASYSGRYMYDEVCFGIVGSAGDYGKFLIAVATHSDAGKEDAQDLADSVRTESMGHDTIFYFPGFTIDN